MPSESPTRMNGMPASSSNRVMGKSYAVSAAIFSPRAFIPRMVSAGDFGRFMVDYIAKTRSNSSGATVAVPILPTTMPAA